MRNTPRRAATPSRTGIALRAGHILFRSPAKAGIDPANLAGAEEWALACAREGDGKAAG